MSTFSEQPLGYSTGSFWPTKLKPISNEVLDFCYEDLDCTAIELGAGVNERLKTLKDLDPQKVKRFTYRSIHSPKITSKDQIEMLEDAVKRFDIHTVNLHPEPDMDWDMIMNADIPWALENMDNNKTFGTVPPDLNEYLKKKDFPYVLDVSHIWAHDNSMGLIKDFYDQLGSPQHYHVSGRALDDKHDALIDNDQKVILDAMTLPAPMIIESTIESLEQAKEELGYIKSILQIS